MKVFLPLVLVALIAVSCGSKKRVYAPPFEEEEIESVIVQRTSDVRATQRGEIKSQTTTQSTASRPVISREEKVTMTHGSSLQRYNIIVGSFANETNAINLRNKLSNEGFNSTIMRNESGMSRVSIAGFDEEIPARNELMRIRDRFSEFSDAWLLITR